MTNEFNAPNEGDPGTVTVEVYLAPPYGFQGKLTAAIPNGNDPERFREMLANLSDRQLAELKWGVEGADRRESVAAPGTP